MKFDDLLRIVGNEPAFESGLLLAGNVDIKNIRLQLTRWTNSGLLLQLRRGLYALAPPYQKISPHPFLVANQLKRGSYVSLQTALSYYGMIPEVVYMITSVTVGRPCRFQKQLGRFDFRHIKTDLFRGYKLQDFMGQKAFIASPEKALLDLLYLQAGSSDPAYINELRLQNLDQLNLELLNQLAEDYGSPGIAFSVEMIINLAKQDEMEFEDL
ncbi:MAG: hypothetical protein WCP19_11125 [Chloroflexota bacterium]